MIRRDCSSSNIMFMWAYLEVFVILGDTYGISVYITPATDMEFDNFKITNRVPEKGSKIGGNLQERVQTEGNHVKFQFKGLGKALILFRRDSGVSLLDSFLPYNNGQKAVYWQGNPSYDYTRLRNSHNERFGNTPSLQKQVASLQLQVEIGGGTNYSKVSIYESAEMDEPLSERIIPNITSVSEYRYFWISWIAHERSIHVGTGNALYENEIISANKTVLQSHYVYLNDIVAVYISTTSSNYGYWRFNIPATGVLTTSIKRTSIATTVLITDAQTPLVTNHASASKLKKTPTTDIVPLAYTATDTQTLSHTNRSTASSIALKTILLIRRTDFRFAISNNTASTGALDLLTEDGQPSVKIAVIKSKSVSTTEQLTSAFAVTTQSTFSKVSDNLSNLASGIRMTITAHKDYGVNHKRFLETPGNISVIGLLSSVVGIGIIIMTGYLIHKRCKNVIMASEGPVAEEENNQDSEENVSY